LAASYADALAAHKFAGWALAQKKPLLMPVWQQRGAADEHGGTCLRICPVSIKFSAGTPGDSTYRRSASTQQPIKREQEPSGVQIRSARTQASIGDKSGAWLQSVPMKDRSSLTKGGKN
jgi:hypothetical protein